MTKITREEFRGTLNAIAHSGESFESVVKEDIEYLADIIEQFLLSEEPVCPNCNGVGRKMTKKPVLSRMPQGPDDKGITSSPAEFCICETCKGTGEVPVDVPEKVEKGGGLTDKMIEDITQDEISLIRNMGHDPNINRVISPPGKTHRIEKVPVFTLDEIIESWNKIEAFEECGVEYKTIFQLVEQLKLRGGD